MMMSKLILRNVRRSIKDYAIYFLTICLAVSMFYAFNSISSQPAMGDLSKSMAIWSKGLTTYIGILSKFISVILAALILYANQFILKRRSKELAIYTTLGMPQRKITGIFLSETILIGTAALLAGIGVGFYLSQVLSALAVQLFIGNVGELILVFSLTAVKETVITFLVIYLAVALLSVRSITKVKLIDMLKQERVNQEITSRNIFFSSSCFLASVVLFSITIYFLLTRGISKESLIYIIVFLVAGIILFFYSIWAVMITLLKKSDHFYYKGLNSFLIKQVSSKLKVNMWVMAALTCLLILSITVLGVGFSVTSSFNQKMRDDKVIDFSVMLFNGKDNPEELLKTNGIDPKQYIKKSEILVTYHSPIEYLKLASMREKNLSKMDRAIIHGTIPLVSETDYNRLLVLIGEEPIELSDDEYLINANYKSILPSYGSMLKKGKEIHLFGRHLKNKGSEVLSSDIMVSLSWNNPGILIVDDSVINGRTKSSIIWNAKSLSQKAEENFYDIINNTFLDMSINNKIYYNSRIVANNAYIGIFGVVAFICSYLGLILIIVTLAVLALQQLTEIQENWNRYLNLAKIGASKSMITNTINKQIGVYFLAPLVPALTLSIFIVKAVLKKVEPFFGMEIGINLVLSVAILLAMYFVYYIVTCIVAQNIIIEKRMNE